MGDSFSKKHKKKRVTDDISNRHDAISNQGDKPKSSVMSGIYKRMKSLQPSGGGVVVNLFTTVGAETSDGKIEIKPDEQEAVYTAEDLCWLAAVKLQIKPISFHLFSLYSVKESAWLAPNDSVKVKSKESKVFEFRLRVRLKESQVKQLVNEDSRALQYIYLQCRTDFINDHEMIKKGDTLDEPKALGLAIMDAACTAKMVNMAPAQLLKTYQAKTFLAKSCFKEYYKLLNKPRLTLNFRPKVEDEFKKSTTFSAFQLRYIYAILKYFPEYLIEEYHTSGMDEALKIVDKKQTTDARKTQTQDVLSVYDQNSDSVIVAIEDIMDVQLLHEPEGMVLINKKSGSPAMLHFETVTVANSFLTLLDKYYRLSVNYAYHISQHINSPMLRWLERNKCHGPVSMKWCESTLKDLTKTHQEFNFMLKQMNHERTRAENSSCWGLDLVMKDPDSRILVYPILWDHKFPQHFGAGSLRIILQPSGERQFDSLDDLIRFFQQDNSSPVKLKKCLSPKRTEKIPDHRLLLCANTPEIEEGPEIDEPLVLRGSACIVPSVELRDVIGKGDFTELRLSTWEDQKQRMVAVKYLQEQYESKLLQFFYKGINKALFWSDANLLRVHGICMDGRFQVIQDYAKHGSLEEFLKTSSAVIKIIHLVQAAEQLASALYFIHEKLEFHGHIQCKNILVFRHSDNDMVTKLADPGLLYYYNAVSLDDVQNQHRCAWLAPELYTNLNKMDTTTDMYAFGITLWEMFAGGMRPWRDIYAPQVRRAVKSGRQLQRLPQCPSQLYQLMQECWELDPSNRITARLALRNIRSVQPNADWVYARPDLETDAESQEVLDNLRNNEQARQGMARLLEEPLQGQARGGSGDQEGRALPPVPRDKIFIPRDRLKKGRELGKGYYGHVYLGILGDGFTQRKVAIKSLKKDFTEQVDELKAEMAIMTKLKHDNIVQVVGECPGDGENPMYIVMEYVGKGSMKDLLIREQDTISPDTLLSFSLDIACGMAYLSGEGIIHNDLAARNVLISDDYRAKIGDFGLSKVLDPCKDYYRRTPDKPMPAFWYAPEAICYYRLSEKSDVWSYGIVLWEIYSRGKSPHLCDDHKYFISRLHKGERLPINASVLPDCPTYMQQMMRRCWEAHRKDRPTFAQIEEDIRQEVKKYNERRLDVTNKHR